MDLKDCMMPTKLGKEFGEKRRRSHHSERSFLGIYTFPGRIARRMYFGGP